MGERPGLPNERPRDDTAQAILRHREIEGDCVDSILFLYGNNVFMRGDLKHAVGRRIDDRLTRSHVLRAEVRDNLRA